MLAHTRFHGVLASLAENRVLEMMLQTIGQIVTHHVLGHADPRHDRETIESDHAPIAKAVVAGAPKKAAKAMERHINTMIDVYETHLGAQLQRLHRLALTSVSGSIGSDDVSRPNLAGKITQNLGRRVAAVDKLHRRDTS